MNAKLNPKPYCKGVRYQWTANGITHHGHTVVTSGTRGGLKQALKRFWQSNTHIQEAA